MEIDKSRCYSSWDSAILCGTSMAGSPNARETSVAMMTVALFLFVAFFAIASGNVRAQNMSQSPSATNNWIISETTSPVDYRPVVVATARSRDSVEGSEMELSISCRNGRTNLMVTGQPSWAVPTIMPSRTALTMTSRYKCKLIHHRLGRVLCSKAISLVCCSPSLTKSKSLSVSHFEPVRFAKDISRSTD